MARTLLALATGATLLFTPTGALFRTAGPAFTRGCSGSSAASLYCLVPPQHLGVARILSALVLLVVASGWRPRVTGVLHWWITFSYFWTALTPQGGDQLASILTLLLVPVTLSDPRRSHWAPSPALRSPVSDRATLVQLLSIGMLFLSRIQVAGVYADSAIGKLGVQQWVDGTALYYWLNDRNFGAPGYLRPLVGWLSNGWVVAGLSWSTIVLEMTIALSLIVKMSPRLRRWLFLAGVGLHAGIAVLMGLAAFSLVMVASLVLLFYPAGDWREVVGWRRQSDRRPESRSSARPEPSMPASRRSPREASVGSSSFAVPPLLRRQ